MINISIGNLRKGKTLSWIVI